MLMAKHAGSTYLLMAIVAFIVRSPCVGMVDIQRGPPVAVLCLSPSSPRFATAICLLASDARSPACLSAHHPPHEPAQLGDGLEFRNPARHHVLHSSC